MKIYQPSGAAREHSPFALNIFSGCPNGCKYCYVPRIFARNLSYRHNDVFLKKDITAKDIWKEVERFAKTSNREEQILLSFTGDIFCGLEKEKVAEVLQALNHYELNFSVLTKRPQNAVEFVSYFQHNEKSKFGVSLTFHDEQKSREWEPLADTPQERLQALSYFKQAGVTTWASFAWRDIRLAKIFNANDERNPVKFACSILQVLARMEQLKHYGIDYNISHNYGQG